MMQVLETREELLEQARDKALESARLKGEFAANVSHELRTPLNAVLGMLELLQDMGLTPKQLEYSTVARNAGEALLKLIEDILDFSRIEAGMLKCQPSDFVLHETLDEVVELMAAQARRKNLRLSYTIGERVPAVLHGEAGRVRQVLINLVGNALKFTEQGAIELGVEADAAGQDPLVLRFSVADTGLGIPATVQDRIFDAFVQADGSSTRHYEGAGLGLAICRQLVQLMGGRIGVDSRLG
ncbi:sensor histidine kinase, partial [Methylomonas koyamae]